MDKRRFAHNVYFSLKDGDETSRQRLLAACREYLNDHPGVLFFAAGSLAAECDRPVNDREFDVALHLVFESREAHDAYQASPRHVEFIAKTRDNWKNVRVFDSYLET